MNYRIVAPVALMAFSLLPASPSVDPATQAGTPNPFYAMDTCTKRPWPRNDIPPAAQLDLLKELGYAGIAWTEEEPGQVKAVAEEAAKRELKVFAIYCAASVGPDGKLSHSPQLKDVVTALKGHGTIIWLHIGGRGPPITKLKGDEPVIHQLRSLADIAAANGLKVAVYPHVGEWTERVQDAVVLAKAVDRKNFGVCFNLCHCLAMGDEDRIPTLLEEAAPHLFTVTINGADAKVKGPDWKRLIQTLDRGSYDVGIVLGKLKQLKFDGPIGLQGYGIGGDRRANLVSSMAAWRKLSPLGTPAQENGTCELLVRVPPREIGKRQRDEMPAEIRLTAAEFAAQRRIDPASLQVVRHDPATGKGIGGPLALRWYDDAVPYDFPECEQNVHATDGLKLQFVLQPR